MKLKSSFVPLLCSSALLVTVVGCGVMAAPAAKKQTPSKTQTASAKKTPKIMKITKTDAQWRKELSPEAYDVLRNAGTERPYTGALLKNHETGVFECGACGLPLFPSDTKFESGTGWPSFYKALPGAVEEKTDTAFGMKRTEVLCARCGSHLGHVFDDGPKPTGLRYCMNSVALKFEKK